MRTFYTTYFVIFMLGLVSGVFGKGKPLEGCLVTGGDKIEAMILELHKSGFQLDVRAWKGLCKESLQVELEKIVALVKVASLRDGAKAARKSRYILINNSFDPENYDPKEVRKIEKRLQKDLGASPCLFYPLHPAISRKDGYASLPVILAPPDKLIRQEIAKLSSKMKDPDHSYLPNAGTIWFKPFVSKALDCFPCPVPTEGVHGGPARNPLMKIFVSPAEQGKVISQGSLLEKARKAIPDRHVLGSADIVLPWDGIYFVRFIVGNQSTSWSWALPIADANGGARYSRSSVNAISACAFNNMVGVDPVHGSCYENQIGGLFWKKLGRHNLLVLPRPRPVGSDLLEISKRIWRLSMSQQVLHRPQERVTVTSEFLKEHPVLVLRKGPRWYPFMEDAVFDDSLLFFDAQADTALVLVISADASPSRIKETIFAYYGLKSKRRGPNK